MEFNGSPGDLMELSALFTDDARVAEAAAVAQKLSKLKLELSFHFLGSIIPSTNSHDVAMQVPCEFRNIPVKLDLGLCRI